MDTFYVFGAKYLLIIVVLISIFWFWKLTPGLRKLALQIAALSAVISYLIAKIGSYLYFDPRPFVVDNFTPLIQHAADNGFPSDHTLLAAVIASVVTSFNPKIGVVLWVLTLLIGLGRIGVGVHHRVDIIGSMVIAALVTYLVDFMFRKRRVV